LFCDGSKLLEEQDTCLTDLALGKHVPGLDPSKCGGSGIKRLEAELIYAAIVGQYLT
jgi:hypothetical protein